MRGSLALSLAVFAAIATGGFWLEKAARPARAADSPPAAAPAPVKLNWGDQGDGTYKNPVLKTDYSDPDITRVGKDFYLIGSAFSFVGMQILQSQDLVNWKIIGQIYPSLSMSPKYDQMNGYSQGTWAPSIRYHNGEFYVYVCTPHDGLYMWHTKNPAGLWSDTVTVKAIARWEDPCPFWDDDGQAYLVHSLYGAGPLILHKMSADGTTLLDDGKEIYRGNVAEGPKLFKRNGYYYISHPEGGVDTGGQVVLRSKNIDGPYEAKQVLDNSQPHQGGIVELDSGEGWFIGFKSDGWLGRVDYLEPVVWEKDDWPTFGDGGKNVDQMKKPNVGLNLPPSHPEVNDEFDKPVLDPVWQWNHNPVNENWSLTEAPGFLRLKALPAVATRPGNIMRSARNTLTQQLWDDFGVIDVKLSTAKLADGQRAGITFESGENFGWIGVEQADGKRHITAEMGSAGPARFGEAGGNGASAAMPDFSGPEVADAIHLRATYEPTGNSNRNAAGHFSFSLDGKTFTPVPGNATLSFSDWKGARIGLFTYGPNSGDADFDYFHYRYFSSKDALDAATAP